jgi:hypothetical protein
MTPKHFLALAAAAALSLVAAITIYSSSVPWTRATPKGVPLFKTLREAPPQIARIELKQGGAKLTLEHKGNDWLLKEHQSFPATPEKVRAFLASLSNAELVEAKTRRKDRYALLGLDGDPNGNGGNAQLVRLIDDKGQPVAEAMIGKQRTDAFGSGKGGTYVRRLGEAQTWLVNAEIDAGAALSTWVDSKLFNARPRDVKSVTVKSPGKDNVDIVLSVDGSEHELKDIPEGMKVKYANSIDDIVKAASSIDFDDVHKLDATPSGDKVSTVTLKLANGLNCDFKIRRDGGVAWITLDASGDGQAKKEADELMARAKGWEFRVPRSKADAILKTRDELLEKAAS